MNLPHKCGAPDTTGPEFNQRMPFRDEYLKACNH